MQGKQGKQGKQTYILMGRRYTYVEKYPKFGLFRSEAGWYETFTPAQFNEAVDWNTREPASTGHGKRWV